ncbi:hypothetical protein GLU60_00565 [Nanohaloarchaea archaeon H01]|nr:hypothetical protein [Nanohaloarchaea archaeon H01]
MVAEVFIWTILSIARILDSFSTVKSLRIDSELEEAMPIPNKIQGKFGLVNGEILISSLVIIVLFPVLVTLISRKDVLFFGWLLSGMYLGFSFRQTYTAINLER